MPDHESVRSDCIHDVVNALDLPCYRLRLPAFADGGFYGACCVYTFDPGDFAAAFRLGTRENPGEPVVRSAHLLLDGGVWSVRLSLHCWSDVPFPGKPVKNSPPGVNLFSPSADQCFIDREFPPVVAGFLAVHNRSGDRFPYRCTDRLDPGLMVAPGLVRLRRHFNRASPAHSGGKMDRYPLDLCV